jgi:hypothetical protein
MNTDTKNWAELGNQVGKKDQHLNKNENEEGRERGGENCDAPVGERT